MTLLWLFVLLWLLGWALALVLMPVAINCLVRYPGSSQSHPRRVLLVSALPLLIPSAATVAMAALASAKSWGWVHDHCRFHLPHHPHFCFEHLPDMLLGHGHGHVAIGVGILSIFAWLVVRHFWQLHQQSTRLAVLTALSRGRGLLRVLADPRLTAFAAGRHPHIYLSQGLLEQLTRHECRMVLAHEAAHIRHRDIWLSRWLDHLLLLQLKSCAGQLRRLWREAIEIRADAQVARRFGRLATAELLLRVTQSMQAAPVPTALGGGDVVARVYALLNGVSCKREAPLFEAVIAALLLVFMISLLASHHAVETILGVLITL